VYRLDQAQAAGTVHMHEGAGEFERMVEWFGHGAASTSGTRTQEGGEWRLAAVRLQRATK